MKLGELPTPALVVERAALEHNLDTMARVRPGNRLRPHVKAHKTTALARLQADRGHRGFTCATVAEVEGLVAAGLGEDVLLANEVLDCRRLGPLVEAGARVTVAVDSDPTVDAAARAGLAEVLVDVDVGLPRGGCAPSDAGRVADAARARGLSVRGVMGYEGHVVGLADAEDRRRGTERSMELLLEAHGRVGGSVVSGGGTGTFAVNRWVTELQAGSYALMDTAYDSLGLPFRRAVAVWSTVVSSHGGWSVCDAGLKSLGMDHGDPTLDGDRRVWFCSDEHITYDPPDPVGTRLAVWPGHVDPTVAYHAVMHLVDGPLVDDTEVVAHWPVDLRGW